MRHAWVEGALDSAWRAVYEILSLDPNLQHLLSKFFNNWGTNPEWTPIVKKAGGELDTEKMLKRSLLLEHMMLAELDTGTAEH